MKRKLMAILLALCMLASLIPVMPVAQAAGSNDIWIHYDTGFGAVYWSKGNYQPSRTADDFVCDSERISLNSSTQLHLLIDPTCAVDRWCWENEQELVWIEPVEAADRNLYVRVSYDTDQGWYDALVVDHGVAVESGYSLTDNILSFKPSDARGSVDVNVYWTDSDYTYMSFESGEDEIMVDYSWNDVEQPELVEEDAVLREIMQPERCRRRVIVPATTQSLSFTWDSYLRNLWGDNVNHDNQWGELFDFQDNMFTLYLDGNDGPDRCWNQYNLGFDFSGDRNYLFGVNYDMNGGLVFQSVGDVIPNASADSFLPRRGDSRDGWADQRSFRGEIGPETICLLLDESKALDWEAWDREPAELCFVEPWHSDDRAISVIARYNGADGWQEEPLVEKGVPAAGVSFENMILRFTPVSGFDVDFDIYWTADDYDFSRFDRTEDKPILVEANWWGAGDVELEDPIDAADIMRRDGRMRIRLGDDVQELTFTWNAGDELRQINVEGLGENGDWLNGIHPDGNHYTLQLNQSWNDGRPRDWYNIQFEFEGGGEARAMAFYDQNKGSVFCALGDDMPTASAACYLDDSFERSVCFKPDGQLQPIHLLLDGSKGLDRDYYDTHAGELRFVNSIVPEEKRAVSVYADCDWCRGTILWNGQLTEYGVEQGVSYENGILTLQPRNSSDLMLRVYWTQADAEFDSFQGTEENPVIVEYRWWNQGEIPVPEGVSEENYVLYDGGGMARIRLPIDRENISFTWAEEYNVRWIGYSVRNVDGEDWMNLEVDPSEPHSFTLELNQTEMMDGRVEPCTWYQVEFEFEDDRRYQVLINWRESEGNVYFGLNEAPPPVEDSESYDLARYYVSYSNGAPSSLMVDEHGEEIIGTVYLRLDPAHSVSYFGEAPTMYELPAYDACPSIYMEFEQDERFEGLVVEDGQAVVDFVTFEDNVLTFTPCNDQPVIVHVFWSREDLTFWDYDITEDKAVMLEVMLGNRMPIQLPADIPDEDVHVWHAAEHDYVKVRIPVDRERLEFTWPGEGTVYLIEVEGAGADGDALRINYPEGKSFTMQLNQQWDGRPRDYYNIRFWGADWGENPFLDVSENAWYYDAVRFAVCMGITNGTSAESFSPNRKLTRAEFITFLWRAFGSPEPAFADCPFDDVPENTWYRKAVCWAVEENITAGTAPSTFSPEQICSRSETIMLLWTANGRPEPENEERVFTDVDKQDFYNAAVDWAVEQGITAGISPTEFGPSCHCTRASAVMFLFRNALSIWRADA